MKVLLKKEKSLSRKSLALKVNLKKRKEFHPDTLISKGLPDELIDRAREKFIEIQEAFKEIEKREK